MIIRKARSDDYAPLMALLRQADELHAQDRNEEAAEIERRIQELDTALDTAERRGRESTLEAKLRVLREALRPLSSKDTAEPDDKAIRREIEELERQLEDLRRTHEPERY